MKKLLIVLSIIFGCLYSYTAEAQTYSYRASTFAFGKRNYQGSITWGDWERSSVVMSIDLDRDRIYVHTSSPQVYRIISCDDWTSDGSGGQMIVMRVIDQDGDRGECKLRVSRTKDSQFYVYFNDVAWVYGQLHRM